MKMMFAWFFGGGEIVLILAVVLILFGAKKLPELAKGLGQGIKEFKKATREVSDELNSAMQDTPAQTTYQPPKAITEPPEHAAAAPATPPNTQPKS